jgi:hypothetical protein
VIRSNKAWIKKADGVTSRSDVPLLGEPTMMYGRFALKCVMALCAMNQTGVSYGDSFTVKTFHLEGIEATNDVNGDGTLKTDVEVHAFAFDRGDAQSTLANLLASLNASGRGTNSRALIVKPAASKTKAAADRAGVIASGKLEFSVDLDPINLQRLGATNDGKPNRTIILLFKRVKEKETAAVVYVVLTGNAAHHELQVAVPEVKPSVSMPCGACPGRQVVCRRYRANCRGTWRSCRCRRR